MGIIGRAVALELRTKNGLYSVELPTSLRGEALDLVSVCNETAPNRAVFVIDEDPARIGIPTVRWAEILSWRTDDDRVFVWERGDQEPDTSFRSVVKPFISGRFPGSPAGECTLDLLARRSVGELWQRHALQPGDTLDSFQRTASWVAKTLSLAFEEAGSTPGSHWSDGFLAHWVAMFQELDVRLAPLAQPSSVLRPRHAWEIVRVSGLPVPENLSDAGNPFLLAPEELPDKAARRLVQDWQKTVDGYLLQEGQRSVLLTALDSLTQAPTKRSPWRDLDWRNLDELSQFGVVPAPCAGQRVFTGNSSPTLLAVDRPAYPVTLTPAWWGVNEADLRRALGVLENDTYFQPSGSCNVLEPVAGNSSTYMLKTRFGSVLHSHKPKKWRAKITVEGVELVFKEAWRRAIISDDPPAESGDGFVWIKPGEAKLLVKGGYGVKFDDQQEVCSLSGTEVLLSASLNVEYPADLNDAVTEASGKWKALRTIQVEVQVRDWIGSDWAPPRKASASLQVVVPSPYSWTVIAANEGSRLVISPDARDLFAAPLESAAGWEITSTPDLLVDKEGPFDLTVYDGSLDPAIPAFLPPKALLVNGARAFSASPLAEVFSIRQMLDEGDIIGAEGPNGAADLAVVKLRERSGNLSSGLLSAVRGGSSRQTAPSAEARTSLLGQFQVQVARALRTSSATGYNSLFQFVIASGEALTTWPTHRGLPQPEFVPVALGTQGLPGIGLGPGEQLVNTGVWRAFMELLAGICDAVGVTPGQQQAWLSGFDPSRIPSRQVKEYVEGHRVLVRAAKLLGPVDQFWASYPLSMIVVDGGTGANAGRLMAILLSPLHPVRLAWAHSVALVARKAREQGAPCDALIGMAEGWNFPYTGSATSMAGQRLGLVAVPIDPGPEQDFAAWSALAVLDENGIARLPALAAGRALPWAGQTGINEKVVERALRDYLVTHPHTNSLEVDIRSVTEAPRSREIDMALLRLLGRSGGLEEVDRLTGNIRIQDSEVRQGPPPTRDKLASMRDGDTSRPFEWRRYEQSSVPRNADLALIENSSVPLAIAPASVRGVIGSLPFRRFCPSKVTGRSLEQYYSADPGEDLLGVTGLLSEIEFSLDDSDCSLQAFPQANALGIGLGARWEIIGTFNMDPGQLASVVSEAQSAGKRLLWEWRPSWLPRTQADLARRPYYVVARMPAALLKALEQRQGLDKGQAFDMVGELGRRGIGLNSLQALGGTQESAALGFFYALRLFLPPSNHPLQPRWAPTEPRSIVGVIPLDPLASIVEALTGKQLEHRADLLIVMLTRTETLTRICFTPVEIKHHGTETNPEQIPGTTNSELRRARTQMVETAETLARIREVMRRDAGAIESSALLFARLTGLATLVELAMDLAPSSPPPVDQAQVLNDILQGNVAIGVGDPVLLWFAPGSMTLSGQPFSIDPHGRVTQGDTLLHEIFVDPIQSPGLWWSGRSCGVREEELRAACDEALRSAAEPCASGECGDCSSPLAQALVNLLHLREEIASTALAGRAPEPVGQQPAAPQEPVQTGASPSPVIDVALPPGGSMAKEAELAASALGESVGDSTQGEGAAPVGTKHVMEPPRAFLGWTGPTSRWTLIGQLVNTGDPVALDLNNPKAMGIFGYMGSGKSYLLGTLIESALQPIEGINELPAPLAVVIYNYRRNAADRFELASLALPNTDSGDLDSLSSQYGAAPLALRDLHILALPGELTPQRLEEYGCVPASELFFQPTTLDVEDWELLMGDPGSNAVFARTIRHVLRELRSSGQTTPETLEHEVLSLLRGQSREAARLRFEFVRSFLSEERGVKFDELVRPGRAVILDLRQPLFSKDDALRFFLVCSSYISRVQGQFNKLVVFDEAHEYLSNEFGERLDQRIRLMRHEGTSYVFATQDVGSIPPSIRRFLTTRFVFNLGTRGNVEDLARFAPEFANLDLQHMPPGRCLIQANDSAHGQFARPRLVHVRPRVTLHGGTSRIFTSGSPDGSAS